MTLGSGGAYSVSTKQKLNTRIPTECELVGIHNLMPQILWTRAYKNIFTVVGQDNQSAKLLEQHG